MTSSQLFRLAGVAALIGGLMRLAGTFAPLWLPVAWQPGWYFATDAFFLLGFTGLFVWQSAAVGWAGLIGYLLGFVGVLVIRTWPDRYYDGAALFLTGVTIFGFMLLLRASLSKWIPGLWIAAFVMGLLGLAGWGPDPFFISGILFSLGFIAAGLMLAHRPAAAN